jgi:hypothetical protein
VTRSASVRRAVAKSRECRLRTVERRLLGHLRFLKRHDRDGYRALVEMLGRVVGRQGKLSARP